MAMVHPQTAKPRRRRGKPGFLALPMLVLAAGIAGGVFIVAWLLWPRWPAPNVSVDVPALPITVQDVTFNIPPNAIRLRAQRKPGTQDRIDVVFMWPSLTPPEERPTPISSSEHIDRIFLTIAASDGALPPLERFKTIYPRYLDNSISMSNGGLAVRPFRTGTPYQVRKFCMTIAMRRASLRDARAIARRRSACAFMSDASAAST